MTRSIGTRQFKTVFLFNTALQDILNSSVPSRMKQYITQPTSLLERRKFIFLWVGGKSTRSIAKEMGVSPSTVSRWISRWRDEGNVNNRNPMNRISHFLSRSQLEKLVHFYGIYLLHTHRNPLTHFHSYGPIH